MATVAALVVGGACGAERGSTTEAGTSRSSPTPPDLVRLVYEETDGGLFEVLADGNRRYRLTVLRGPDAGQYQVFDGVALLTYNPQDEAEKYLRQEQPSEDEFPKPTFFYRPGTEEFEKICPKARRLGAKTLYGRNAVRYACDALPPDSPQPEELLVAREIALDEQTGLMLVDGPYVPVEVTFGPPIEADTFSTAVPEGAGRTNVPPGADETKTPSMLGEFRLPAVGGGYLSDTSYRGKPLVIVVGSPNSLESELARVLPLTGGGAKPVTIGILVAVPPSDWQGSLVNPDDEKAFIESVSKTAGPFAVPVGIDVKGAAARSIVEGLPELIPPEGSTETAAAIALVGSDGTIALTSLAEDASDTHLRSSLAALS